jgi:hypothetical protein
MLSRRPARDAELLHAVEQRGAPEAEACRGTARPADHPVGLPQHLHDVLALDLIEKQRACGGQLEAPEPPSDDRLSAVRP